MLRRETLINALRRLGTDVVETGLQQIFRELGDKAPGSKESIFIPLDTFQKYSIASSRYSATERRIMEILGLGPLLDPGFWQSLQTSPDRAIIFHMLRSLNNLTDVVPRIIDLIAQDYVDAVVRKDESSLPKILVDKEIVSVILAEDEGVFSSPDRLVFSIQAISDLYFVHSQLQGLDGNDLIVLACDSGSDKSFDFLGAAKAIAALKDTIIFLWDSTVYFRHGQARATVDTIAKTLSVLAQIADLESSKTLAPEMAEQLRRKTLGACSKFYEAGVIIPEMSREATQFPRSLMAPERRLLAGPQSVENNSIKLSDEVVESPNDATANAREAELDLAAQIRELQKRLDQAEKQPRPSRRKRTPPKS